MRMLEDVRVQGWSHTDQYQGVLCFGCRISVVVRKVGCRRSRGWTASCGSERLPGRTFLFGFANSTEPTWKRKWVSKWGGAPSSHCKFVWRGWSAFPSLLTNREW